jgi:hypothetical protein
MKTSNLDIKTSLTPSCSGYCVASALNYDDGETRQFQWLDLTRRNDPLLQQVVFDEFGNLSPKLLFVG